MSDTRPWTEPGLHGRYSRIAPTPLPPDVDPDVESIEPPVPPGDRSNGRFGRMFPSLRGLDAPDAALTQLADAMREADPDAATGDNPAIPAGFTYLGQFIDHDVTFDPTALGAQLVDPASLRNFRTPAFDLDSVYGLGPDAQPYLYDADDPALFLIGRTSDEPGRGDETVKTSLPFDLPRGPNRRALIGDPRNDENLVVAQTHLAFLRFHNKVVAGLRDGTIDRFSPTRKTEFEEAHDIVAFHYQWIVLKDFLGRLIDPVILQEVLDEGPQHFTPDTQGNLTMPVEFSAASYRFGHSQVRPSYDYNRVFTPAPGGVTPATLALLFRFTGMSGDNAPIPSDWIIDWNRWYEIDEAGTPNPSRRIDPFLTAELHTLPKGGGSLPDRNLRRGKILGLPPGQSVAGFLGFTPLTRDQISQGADGAVAKTLGFDVETPLWFYILKEAQLEGEGGGRLGPVGSTIVAEVFVGLLDADPSSFRVRKPTWKPSLGRTPGEYTMADLLHFTGDLSPIDDAANRT